MKLSLSSLPTPIHLIPELVRRHILPTPHLAGNPIGNYIMEVHVTVIVLGRRLPWLAVVVDGLFGLVEPDNWLAVEPLLGGRGRGSVFLGRGGRGSGNHAYDRRFDFFAVACGRCC